MRFTPIIFLMLIFTECHIFSAPFLWRESSLGLTPKYSSAIGIWAPEFSPGFNIGFTHALPTSLWSGRLFFLQELGYGNWSLKTVRQSSAQLFSYGLYPAMKIALGRGVFPYIAAGVQLSDFYLIPKSQGTAQNFFGYFLTTRVGLIYEYSVSWGASLQTEYAWYPYINHNMSLLSVSLGANYRFAKKTAVDSVLEKKEKIQSLQNEAKISRDLKDWPQLQKIIQEILLIDDKNEIANVYTIEIQDEKAYRSALESITNHGELAAIPSLEKLAHRYLPAQQKLTVIRNNLKEKIPGWLQEAIQAYDKNDYKKCIKLMNQILLINPDERKAKIYLPRAQKRLEAWQKLDK